MTRQQVISILKTQSGFVSGEDISRRLNISRSAIWKSIDQLRKDGYVIDAVPHQGYRLKKSPDRLITAEITHGLTTQSFGKNVHHFDTIESTMSEAFALGMDGACEGTLVCAESQTKGKGRLGRKWVSPKGKGIYMSLIVRPDMSPVDVARLTLMSGVAVCEALNEETGLDIGIKWPNDLMIGGRKVAGLLTEMNAEMERVNFVVIGIGINVNTPASQMPDCGTSLKAEAGRGFDRREITQKVLQSLEKWYMDVCRSGFDPMLNRWRELSATIGRQVSVSEGGKVISGEAMDVDVSGGLVIRGKDGDVIKRMSGDVTILK